MPSSLTDQNISDTYKGVLHANGTSLPTTEQVIIYDGDGNASALKLGRQGATINSLSALNFKANGISYPTTSGSTGQVLKLQSNDVLTFDSINSSDLPDIVPNSIYSNITSMHVDEKGRVIDVGIQPSGPGGSYTPMTVFAAPITLFGTYSLNVEYTVDASHANKPTNVTHAYIQIRTEVDWHSLTTTKTHYTVYINDIPAVTLGNKVIEGGNQHVSHSSNTFYYAELDNSDSFTVKIVKYDDGSDNSSHHTSIYLYGYTVINTISNT